MTIHATAIISKTASIGVNVRIGPYAVIGEQVQIGDNCVVHAHAVINDHVKLGQGVEVFPGAVIGKEPKGAGALARQPHFEKRIVIGDECAISPHAVIYYDVEIGANTLIGDGASIREKCKIGSKCIISRCVTINYHTQIGDFTKIMDNTHITGNTVIGNEVFISTQVGTTNDNFAGMGYGDHIKGPIIEDGAMIGVGVSMLPNVHIGRNAVVAAGSVVTKQVAEDTLVAGVPARFVRRVSIA